MPDPIDTPSNTEPPSSASGDPKASRRRLLQGALASAPVLMTLISRPVLAQRVQTPSAFCSGNESAPAGAGLTSTGRSPGYWKQEHSFHSWTPPFYPTTVPGGVPATLFDSVFAPHYSGKTLLDVLELRGGPPDDVARHIVAALLNIAAGWTPVITIQTLKEIWSEYITKGYFEPTAAVHWDNAKIVDYLMSTMPA